MSERQWPSCNCCQVATLGANCTVVCGITIGRYVFIGACARVNKNVPAYAFMVGVPAKQIGWISRYGELLNLPLRSDAEATCPHTGQVSRLNSDVCELSN